MLAWRQGPSGTTPPAGQRITRQINTPAWKKRPHRHSPAAACLHVDREPKGDMLACKKGPHMHNPAAACLHMGRKPKGGHACLQERAPQAQPLLLPACMWAGNQRATCLLASKDPTGTAPAAACLQVGKEPKGSMFACKQRPHRHSAHCSRSTPGAGARCTGAARKHGTHLCQSIGGQGGRHRRAGSCATSGGGSRLLATAAAPATVSRVTPGEGTSPAAPASARTRCMRGQRWVECAQLQTVWTTC